MKAKKKWAILLAVVLPITFIAGCANNSNQAAQSAAPATSEAAAATPTPEAATATPETAAATTEAATAAPASGREPYNFSFYANYNWETIRKWGEDETSKYWGQKFNISWDLTKPDGDENEALNLKIASNDLPDAIWMDRAAPNIRMARLGMLVDIDTLKPMLENNWYDENVLQRTQDQIKIDGKLYGIPNWPRKNASGGNCCWMYTTDIYGKAGSPKIMTFEDLYAYACAVRDNVPKTAEGLDVIPVITNDGAGDAGTQFVRAIYRSMGGPYLSNGTWYGRVGDQYQLIFRDPVYIKALLEANKWYREGLIKSTSFTDSQEQFLEKLTTARCGLIWYDMSQDDGNNFRKTIRTAYPGNSVELVTMENNGKTYLYPPANGLAYDKIYGEHYGTLGWNVVSITSAAKHPERILELFSYFLTKQGSIEMMYGPQGGYFWDQLDANGNPILKASPDENPDQVNQYALWYYTFTSQADNVDTTKFAVNDAMPPEKRSWVVSNQAHIFTPLMSPLTDEYEGMNPMIEPDTDLANARTLCEDYMKANLPLIIMADSADAAQAKINELMTFVEANGIKDIEKVYNDKYQANLALQGGTIFNR